MNRLVFCLFFSLITTEIFGDIVVSGKASVSAKPDIAYATISVATSARDNKTAKNDNNIIYNKVVEVLKSEKYSIEEKHIRTSGIEIRPNYTESSQPNQPPRITSFFAINRIVITIKNIDVIGELVDDVVAAGANRLENLQFDVEDKTQLLTQARANAVKNAKDIAKIYADGLGIKVGVPKDIAESEYYSPAASFNRSAAPGGASDVAEVFVGEKVYNISVRVTFSINSDSWQQE